MNSKLLSASIVFGLMIGSASPLQAQAVPGAVNGVTGGFAQGNLGSAAHGRLDGAVGGSAAAGLPERPQATDTAKARASQAGDAAGERAERTSDSAGSRSDAAGARASLLADGSVSKAVGVAGRAADRADDARPEPDRPERPERPVDAELGVIAATQGNAGADHSGARADARGAPSVSASGSAPRGAEVSAEMSGTAAVAAEADSPR
ncbi:MAG TPA: hypothetical protein VMQ83_10230 [Gammaproteobacteria bacterium]|nr:hypothetical protein [Gammaproteobacteria bacterium]